MVDDTVCAIGGRLADAVVHKVAGELAGRLCAALQAPDDAPAVALFIDLHNADAVDRVRLYIAEKLAGTGGNEILARQITCLHAHVDPLTGLCVEEGTALGHFLLLHAVGQVAAVALVPALQPAIVAHPHKTFDDINIQNTHLQTPLYFQMRLHSTFCSYFFTSSNHAPSTGTPFRRQYSSQTSPKGRVFSSSCRTISSVNWLVSCNSFSAA